MHTRFRFATGRALAVSLLLAAATAPAANVSFNGYARDIQTGAPLYVEQHFVRASGTRAEERVVLYRCAKGTDVFARKELVFGAVRQEPSFVLRDGRTGYVEGLRRTAQGPRVFVRESANVPERERAVPSNVAIVSDAGFDEFVRVNWAQLEKGGTLRFPFLVPSRLDYLTFKVRKNREETIDGAPASVIRLNLSGVLGWFLPYIEVSYRKSDRVLMRYKGLTNIRDLQGRNKTAIIEFPSRERVALDAMDLEAKKALPLAARCP